MYTSHSLARDSEAVADVPSSRSYTSIVREALKNEPFANSKSGLENNDAKKLVRRNVTISAETVRNAMSDNALRRPTVIGNQSTELRHRGSEKKLMRRKLANVSQSMEDTLRWPQTKPMNDEENVGLAQMPGNLETTASTRPTYGFNVEDVKSAVRSHKHCESDKIKRNTPCSDAKHRSLAPVITSRPKVQIPEREPKIGLVSRHQVQSSYRRFSEPATPTHAIMQVAGPTTLSKRPVNPPSARRQSVPAAATHSSSQVHTSSAVNRRPTPVPSSTRRHCVPDGTETESSDIMRNAPRWESCSVIDEAFPFLTIPQIIITPPVEDLPIHSETAGRGTHQRLLSRESMKANVLSGSHISSDSTREWVDTSNQSMPYTRVYQPPHNKLEITASLSSEPQCQSKVNQPQGHVSKGSDIFNKIMMDMTLGESTHCITSSRY